jgi:hypothetical protein
MRKDISAICSDLEQVADSARRDFGSLSPQQLNWKPAEKSWSIAQCFDHLINTHSLYFTVFQRLANGDKQSSFLERVSPFSGFFGRLLIKNLDPTNLKKMKATASVEPSASEIGGDIIDRFCGHQHELIKYIQALPPDIAPAKTIITSPLLGFVTYSLEDCFTVLVVHCQRHFGQAKRVTEVTGFPA